MADPILVARDGAIATVTLNRPEKRNALNREGWQMLAEAFATLNGEDDLRCVVLTGAGDKAFCAGADITGFESERANSAQVRDYEKYGKSAFGAVSKSRHPVIAAIHGYCIGGGMEIALEADIRISADTGKFGIPVKYRALYLGYGNLETLTAVAGRAAALEVVLEGRVYDAPDAERMGLINRVVPAGKLDAEVAATAERIAEGAPLSARFHRKAIRRLADPAPLTKAELDEAFAYADSEDYREGYMAFLEKRKARFTGR